MKEDYSKSRSLATLSHMGVTFKVCRHKIRNKTSGFLVFVYEGAHMARTYGSEDTLEDAVRQFTESLVSHFPPGEEQKFRESLNRQQKCAAYGNVL